MINKIFTFIIILSFGSFLLSGEATKISNKEKTKTRKVESKEKQINNKEKRNINKIKPSRVNPNREQEIRSLKKGFRLQQMEIEERYRSEAKKLRLKKEKELEVLKIELKNKMNQIRNS